MEAPPPVLEELKDEISEPAPPEKPHDPMPLTLKSVHSTANIDPDDPLRVHLAAEETTAASTQGGGVLPPVGVLNVPEILLSHSAAIHHSLYVASSSNMKIYQY